MNHLVICMELWMLHEFFFHLYHNLYHFLYFEVDHLLDQNKVNQWDHFYAPQLEIQLEC